VTYEGLLRELEQNHHLTAPDWEAPWSGELCLRSLSTNCRTKHVTCSTTGYWGSPGMRSARALRLSGKQARSRFYYELDKVHAKLLGSKPKGPGHSEESD